jgi:IS605 OrfB family transposase
MSQAKIPKITKGGLRTVEIYSTYSVKIKHYNHIFKDTIRVYRDAVDFLIGVCMQEWDELSQITGRLSLVNHVEHLTHKTRANPEPEYPAFDKLFYKLPSYLRRSAISEAIGKVSSYQSNHANWEAMDTATHGDAPGHPRAGYIFPAMYKDGLYIQTGEYTAMVKVFTRNTWDWLPIRLRKSDMDYISRHCKGRKACAPTLQKRGKEWFLDFPFVENVKLHDTPIREQTILAVDLGISQPATVSVMTSDGTILGRHFLRLPKEQDSLDHAVNRIKKAQQHGNRKMPRLWARVNGINRDISVKTAQFIMDTAALYHVDTIVFEHLDVRGKKRGSKKQKLHLWRKQEVQSMVTGKAHRSGMRVAHVNAWGTSRLAYDGSGRVLRGRESEHTINNYSLCEFPTGKLYHCDLNATYNIGSRYFIRELLKSLPETVRLHTGAKVPRCSKRSTCTLSDLLSLNAALLSA